MSATVDTVSCGRALAQAVEHYQAGDLRRSREILAGTPAREPKHFDALHLLGVVSAIGGESDEAEALFKRASRVDGNHARLRIDLGPRSVESLASYGKALALNIPEPSKHE